MSTLMHCAPRTQIILELISCYTKLLIVERLSLSSYFKDLVSARTAPAMRSKQIVNEERSVKYPLEKKLSAAVRTVRSIRSKKTCHPFERL